MVSDRRTWRGTVLIAAGVLLAALLAAVITTVPFRIVRNSGRTMEPALKDDQRLIVSKLIYWFRDPRPGDVVMLLYPLDPTKVLIKRVIAGQGDTVRIAAGHVYVNDKLLSDNYVADEFRGHDDWGPQIVPAGFYFVLGDRRTGNADS